MTSLAKRALRGALVFWLVCACASSARAAEPVVIGEINPLTGALALQGTSVHEGIVLAVEEQNARGGIGGRLVTLLSRDDKGRSGRVAVFYSPTPGASQLARRQREAFEQSGVRVLVYEPLAAGLSDFTPLLARVRDQGADVLISNTFFADHLVLVRQMAEGLFGTTASQPGIAAPGQEADSRAFVDAYAKRFGAQPAPLAMHGYAAARALMAALEAAARNGRPISGPGLRDALAAADVMTPMGRVRFDERGDPLDYERVILQIQDGRHVVVWPKERAQAAAR